MKIKELQEELVEKISLIPTEDDRSSLERALEIINQLEKDYINNIITINYGKFTALDYVIIADSQGNNEKLSSRPRINNRMLKELETAIRDIEGKISEELETDANTHRTANDNFEVVRLLIERGANVNVAQNDGTTPLDLITNDNNLEEVRSLLEGVTVQSSVEERGNSL